MIRRFALWYGLSIGSIGALHPFLAVLLEKVGASERQFSSILAIFPIGFLIAGPLWAYWADRVGQPKRLLKMTLLLSVVGATWMLFSNHWLMMVPGIAILAVSRAPCVTLVDVLVTRSSADGAHRYGWARLWGSVGFIGAVYLTGWLSDAWWRAPLLGNAILLSAAMVVVFWLPTVESPARSKPVNPLQLLKIRPLVSLYVIAILHIAAVSAYDHFYALHAGRLGLSSRWIGTAVALGVAMEVTVMALGPWLIKRLGARLLILIAVTTSIFRWWVTGVSDTHWVLVVTQSMHGLSFGAFWIGGVAWTVRYAPLELRNTAQSLFVASGWGVGSILSLASAALLLDDVGTGGFFSGLAVVSVLTTVCAIALFRRKDNLQ